MTDGLVRYINKWKASAWVRSRGLQLPKDGSPNHRQAQRELQHRDVFNSPLKQGGDARHLFAGVVAIQCALAGIIVRSPNLRRGLLSGRSRSVIGLLK